MPLKVDTAQYRYRGPDRLDITAKGNDPVGKHFAPTWDMVMDLKWNRFTENEYSTLYYQLVAGRFTFDKGVWVDLINRDHVVLVCFCKPGAFCHRLLLKDILVALGAEPGEEII